MHETFVGGKISTLDEPHFLYWAAMCRDLDLPFAPHSGDDFGIASAIKTGSPLLIGAGVSACPLICAAKRMWMKDSFDSRVFKLFEAFQSLEDAVFRLDEKGSAASYKHSTAVVLQLLGLIESTEIHPDCEDLRSGDEDARMREALIRPIRIAERLEIPPFSNCDLMSIEPPSDCSKLCVHTMTTKPWGIHEAIQRYAASGIAGITVWRQWLEEEDIAAVGEEIRSAGLEIVSLCRGGFFPGNPEAREDNEKAIEEAAALGAPMIVLVCGAVPGQPLAVSRDQIRDGIAEVLPLARRHGIRLAIEPLHPMYADDRSAINTIASANQVCDELNDPLVGLAVDVYHVWWDPDLESQIRETADRERLFAFHICDWLTPTKDLLNDRGLMGEGCIDIREIRGMVENCGFTGFHEVEIFSDRWWAADQDEFLDEIKKAYLAHS